MKLLQNRVVLQNAWVTDDVEGAMMRWVKTMGVGPFFVTRGIKLDHALHRGKPSDVEFIMAVAQAGDTQIEFICQQNDAPSCFRDTVPKGKEAFHHIAVVSPNYDEEVARYKEAGFAEASFGVFNGMRVSYFDTTPALGVMLEILEENANLRAFFKMVKDAGDTWDGVTDPIRYLN